MALPLLGLLAGAGLLGAQSHFATTAGSNPGYLNRLLNIRRPDPAMQNLGRVDLMSETAPQQLQALAAQSADPQQQQYLFSQAQSLAQRELNLAERMAAARAGAAAEAEQTAYDRQQDLIARQDAFRQRYVSQFQATAEAQANYKALENALVSGTATDAVGSTFAIMKVFDPTSTVRTEEGRQVVEAEGPAAALANQLNKILSQGWNETTRREWYDTVTRFYKPRAESSLRALEDARNWAADQGFAPGAARGAGVDVDRLRGTATGTRANPFPEIPRPAVTTRNDGVQTVTGPQGQTLVIEQPGGRATRQRRRN